MYYVPLETQVGEHLFLLSYGAKNVKTKSSTDIKRKCSFDIIRTAGALAFKQ